MSLALSTWQSVLSFAAEYYTPQLPLYFSERHFRILLDMIGHALGLRSYRVALVDVPMPEPITCLETAVIVSRPLVGFYMNQPTKLPEDPIGFVNNVDLLSDIRAETASCTRLDLSGRPLQGRDAPFGRVAPRCPDSGNPPRLPQSLATYNPMLTNSASYDDDDKLQQRTSTSRPTLPRDSRLTDEDTVRVQHLLRLALMVAHWDQHRRRGIPYTTHEGFENIEGPPEMLLAYGDAINEGNLSITASSAKVGAVTSISAAENADTELAESKRRKRSPLAIAQESLEYQ